MIPRNEASHRWGLGAWLFVAATFAIGFASFPLRALGLDFAFLPGDFGDNRLNNFILEHGYRWLVGLAPSFWDAPMLFPTAGATARSDAHIGMLPIYACFRVAGCSPERAFQFWFLVPFVLNFAASAWSLKRLGFGPVAAATGAYTFTFSLAVAAKIMHAQLLPRFFVPLAFVFAWEFLRKPTTGRLAAVAVCVAAQSYFTVYIGYFLVLLLGAVTLVSLLFQGRQAPWRELLIPGWRVWVSRMVVVGLAALAVYPLVHVHSRGVGRYPPGEFTLYSPEPATWITPPPQSRLYPELAAYTGLGKLAEQQIFPGISALLAVGFGCVLGFRRGRLSERWACVAVSAWAALLLAALVTDYGCWWTGAWWPYGEFIDLPGARGIRAVGRIVLVLTYPAAIAVGASAEWIVSRVGGRSRSARVIAATLVLGLVAADHWLTPTTGSTAECWAGLRYPLETALAHQRQIADAIRRGPAPACVHVFPSATSGGGAAVQLEAMRATQDLGVPCVNGRTGHFPDGWDDCSYYPDYRSLMSWLVETNGLKYEDLAGLVMVGEPTPDFNLVYEAGMRALFPPRRTR